VCRGCQELFLNMFSKGRRRWDGPGPECELSAIQAKKLAVAEITIPGFRLRGLVWGIYLVAVEAVTIPCLKRHLKIAAIEFAVTEPRVVVLVSVPISAAVAKVATSTPTTIAIDTAL